MTTEQKVIGGIGLVTLLIIGGGLYFSSKGENEYKNRLTKPMMGEKIPDLGGEHVPRGTKHGVYNSNPPTSGPHWVDTAGGGVKYDPTPDELLLHSMEHGAVVVWYKEGLDQAEINKIKEAYDSASGKKIMISRKDLDVPVALTSWGYLLKLQTVDQAKIKEFIETNNDRGPEQAPI